MAKKSCGQCFYFHPEPNSVGRGCCFNSTDLDSYQAVGKTYKACDFWKPRVELKDTDFLTEILNDAIECLKTLSTASLPNHEEYAKINYENLLVRLRKISE